MLLIGLPVTLIHIVVRVLVYTIPLGLIIHPRSIKFIAISMEELPFTIRTVVAPLALVLSIIRPYLDTEPTLFIAHPFTLVCGSRLKSYDVR